MYQKIQHPSEITEDIAELLGYFLGDGSVEKHADKTTTLAIDAQDSELFERFSNTLKKHFGFEPGEKNVGNCKILRIFRADFVNWMKLQGFYQKDHIPEQVPTWKPNLVKAFLRGFFEADGSIGKNGVVELGQKNIGVLQTVQHLLLGLGILSVVKPRKLTEKGFKAKNSEMNYLRIIGGTSKQIFTRDVGFISERKIRVLTQYMKRCSRNGNSKALHEGLPNQNQKIEKWLDSVIFGDPKFRNAFKNNYVNKSKNLSKGAFKKYCEKYPIFKTSPLQEMVSRDEFYDKVEVKNLVKRPIRDITVPTTNSYVAGGFVNHNSHYLDLCMIAPAIKETMVAHDNVDLVLFGYMPTVTDYRRTMAYGYQQAESKFDFELFYEDFGKRISYKPWVPIQTYHTVLPTFGADIVLAPVIDTDFNKARSNLKVMEASSIGLPVIASKMYPYEHCLDDEGTIPLLAKNYPQWKKHL